MRSSFLRRLLAGPWIGALYWREEPDSMALCQLDTGDSVRIDSICLDPVDAEPVSGEPKQLLSEWQWRLGLRISADARLSPAS